MIYKGFFDNIDHDWMVKFLEHDIADKNFIRYIKRFLIGGMMEDGKKLNTEVGTVQGGLISPVLANVYLHYVLDTWFVYMSKREFSGEMYMVRYADDFVCLFQYEQEAQKFYRMLVERMKKFGLELAENKSRIMPFGRYKGTKESFDFPGFTHYNGKSHWGKYCVLHRTSKKKLMLGGWLLSAYHYPFDCKWVRIFYGSSIISQCINVSDIQPPAKLHPYAPGAGPRGRCCPSHPAGQAVRNMPLPF